MKNHFRKISLVMVVIAMLVSVTGCMGCGELGDDRVTVRVTLANAELPDEMMAQFMADNPDIRIELAIVDEARLLAEIASGQAPDIMRMAGATQLATMVTRGLAMNIQPFVDASETIDEDDFHEIVNVFRFNPETNRTGEGDLFGLPKDWSLDFTYFINTQIFEENGIPIPDYNVPMTFDEWHDWSVRATTMNEDGETTVFGSAGWSIGFSLINIEKILNQKGHSLWSEDFTRVYFDTPQVREIFHMINDLIQARGMESLINPAPGGWPYIFPEERVAMVQAGYWYSGAMRTWSEELLERVYGGQFLKIPAPQLADARYHISPTAAATGAIIWAGTRNPAETWRVFEWYFTGTDEGGGYMAVTEVIDGVETEETVELERLPGPARARAELGFGLPILNSLFELLPTDTEFDRQTLSVVLAEVERTDSLFVQMNPYIDAGAVDSILGFEINPVIAGERTIDHALPIVEEQVQRLIDEGMDLAAGFRAAYAAAQN